MSESGSCFSNPVDTVDHFTLPNRTEAITVFPPELLQYNLSQTADLLNRLVYSGIPPNTACIIDLLKCQNQKQNKVNKAPYPHQVDLSVKRLNIQDYTLFDKMEKEKLYTDLQARARDSSPLKGYIEENRQLREEIEHLKKDNSNLRQQLEQQPPDFDGNLINPIQADEPHDSVYAPI